MVIILKKPAVGPVHVDSERIQKTIKLVSRDRAAVTDVLMLVQAQGIKPDQVVGLCNGPPGDPAFYVSFKDIEAVEKMKSREKLCYRNQVFSMVALGSQIVTLRVHWLPLYFNDSIVKSTFAEFGKVISVDRAESRGLQNGIRVIQLEVSEEERLALPHLVSFACGTTMLVTMQGRPPFCLRCHGLGHVRRDCPMAQRSYAHVITDDRRQEPPKLPQPQQQQPQQPQRPLDENNEEKKDGNEQPVSQVQQQQPTESLQPDGEQQLDLDSSEDSMVSENLVIDENPQSENVEDDNVEMEIPPSSLKRNLGEDEADSFPTHFPPQKVVRQNDIDIRNRYQVLQDLTTLLEDV